MRCCSTMPRPADPGPSVPTAGATRRPRRVRRPGHHGPCDGPPDPGCRDPAHRALADGLGRRGAGRRGSRRCRVTGRGRRRRATWSSSWSRTHLTWRRCSTGPDGILAGAAAGLVVAAMGTHHPAAMPPIAERCLARGVRLLDAPVSGGEVGAIEGSLSIMAGGDAEAYRAGPAGLPGDGSDDRPRGRVGRRPADQGLQPAHRRRNHRGGRGGPGAGARGGRGSSGRAQRR